MSDLIDPRPVAVLTSREKEVLEQLAEGRSAKEVARGLSIAPRTVERHIENLRLKLHARNTAHLITRAFFAGVLGLVATGGSRAGR